MFENIKCQRVFIKTKTVLLHIIESKYFMKKNIFLKTAYFYNINFLT